MFFRTLDILFYDFCIPFCYLVMATILTHSTFIKIKGFFKISNNIYFEFYKKYISQSDVN